MDRITRKLAHGGFEFVDEKGYANLNHKQGMQILFERLAAYEDTGLSPEEILKSKNKEENQMKPVITKEHIYEFNEILLCEGSVIRLRKEGDAVNIVLPDDIYIDNFIINITDKFYQKLKQFFESKGIYNLSYNNTGSCFWKFE